MTAGPLDTAAVEALVSRLTDEFMERLDRGERPDLEDYAQRYPQVAAVIRQVFPALQALHRAGSASNRQPGMPGAALEPGGCLGEYRIVREVGRGGMGVVYEAEQQALGRRVALKVLPPEARCDPVGLERFRREARAAGRLHHTNIVPVHDVGECQGVHYFAMQFIDGHALDEVLTELRRLRLAGDSPEVAPTVRAVCAASGLISDEPPTPPVGESPSTRSVSSSALAGRTSDQYHRNVALVGAQVAEALAHAHGQKVLHRDVKPSNLLLDMHGVVWLTDFGLAKQEGDDLTRTGDIVGTLRYLAPERLSGQCDHRSDVYGLGVTLYEMLTLRPPFNDSDRGQLVRRLTHDDPPRPRSLDPSIPRDLETVVLKAIDKDPTRRYARAADLAEDLRRFHGDRPVRARRVGAPERAWRWCRRNPGLASVSGASALLLAAVAALSFAWALSSQGQLRQTRQAERKAKFSLFEARLAQAKASRWSRRIGQRFDTWEALTEAAQLARELELGEERLLELRGEAVGCLALADLRLLKEYRAFPAELTVAFTPDLTCYARSDSRGNISVRRVEDDFELVLLPADGPDSPETAAHHIRFSADGELLAVRHHENRRRPNVRVWDWRRRQMLFRPPGSFPYSSLDLSPDSRRLALGHPDGTLTVHEARTGRELNRFRIGGQPSLLAYNPDGSRLAVVDSRSSSVRVIDPSSGRSLREWPLPSYCWRMAWHPGGVLLAVGQADQCLSLWDTTTGQQRALLRGHQGPVAGQLSFTPDGGTLLSSAWDNRSRLWDVWTQRELLNFTGGDGQFSSDGRRLATLRGRNLSLWEVALSQECRALPRSSALNRDRYLGGSVSPDGRWLALGGSQGIGLWDLCRGSASAFLPEGQVHDVQFHPSGRELWYTGQSGLFSAALREEPGRLVLRYDRKPLLRGALARLGMDFEGHLLAVSEQDGKGLWVLDPRRRPAEARLLPQFKAIQAAVSPDGKWVASGVHHGFGTKVWEARTRRSVRHLHANEHGVKAFFSPNGRFLLTTTVTECCLWSLRSWELAWEIPRDPDSNGMGYAAFARDRDLLAVLASPSAVQLFDVATRQPLTRLQATDIDVLHLVALSPDGGQLVTVAEAGDAWVWDLRRIRQRLGEIGLDWDQPSYGPLPEPPPMRVDVELVGPVGTGPKK